MDFIPNEQVTENLTRGTSNEPIIHHRRDDILCVSDDVRGGGVSRNG